MSQLNVVSFNDFLAYQVFTGTASMRSAASTPDGGGNTTELDNVRMIAASIYNDHAGIQGLSKLLDILALSMTNAYALPDIPSSHLSTLMAFPGYAPPQTCPPQHPEHPAPSRYTSRYSGLG